MDLQPYLDPLLTKLQGWAQSLIAGLPNFIIALAVIAAAVVIGRWSERFARRAASHLEASQAIARLMASMTKYAIMLVGVVVALGILGLQKTVVSLLAGAGVAGLAIGFAFQDLAANFIAGIAMGFRKPFEIGHIIRTADFFGKVEVINLRNTIIRTFDGQRVIIPNRQVFENPLINFNSSGTRRVDIPVGVAYETDLQQATTVAREAVAGIDARAEGSDVDIVAYEFGTSSINFKVRYWIPYPEANYPQAVHAGVLAIKRAFDEHDISIPFPIRTLDLSRTADDAGRFVVEAGDQASVAA